jgi:RNA polymerase sigma-70 factor, ECF subfamily
MEIRIYWQAHNKPLAGCNFFRPGPYMGFINAKKGNIYPMTFIDNNRDDRLINLIARCALRDQNALKLLFDQVGPYLNAIAWRILRSPELSNEVLQEAFLQIWNNAASYRPHMAKPLTWMASITRYRALDRLDKETRSRNDTRTIGDDEDFPGGDEPEQSLGASQLRFHLHQCLTTLGDNIKRSIELAYLQGCSREEIARTLSTNTNTVKSWLHRGAERLKLCLEAKQQPQA